MLDGRKKDLHVKGRDKIRVVIADDEPPAREELHYLLRKISGVEILEEAGNGKEAIEAVVRNRPDLVFLDIRMPGLDGIEVANCLKGMEERPQVVFVTAYNRYALKAFESWALDYLLKPIDLDRLKDTVERVRGIITTKFRTKPQPWDDLVKQLGPAPEGGGKRKISIRKAGNTILVSPENIVFFCIEEGVVYAITTEFKGMVSYRSLEEIERDFPSDSFFRSHRGFLINLNRIDQINRAKLGSYELTMDNRQQVPLSRRNAKALRKIIKW